jgi:hypothetical protein
MRRTIFALIAAVLVLNAVPAAAAPPVSCDDQGREHFTTSGLNLQMAPPSVAAYELAERLRAGRPGDRQREA